MANQRATDFEKCFVDVTPPFVANPQASELVQPTEGPLNNPTIHTQTAAVLGISSGNERFYANLAQRLSICLRIVRTIRIKLLEAISRRPTLSCNGRHVINQRQQLRHVVPIGGGEANDDGHTVAVSQQMVFGAWFSAVYRARTGRFAPPTARTVELSTVAREKSIWLAFRSLFNKSRWIFSQTPACCHSARRRQQVIPQPQPISCGRSSQGMPVLRTNSTPVNVARLGNLLRPELRFRRLLTGINGSIVVHNASETRGLAMAMPPCMTWSTHRLAISMPFC